jgi:hypothetical protein
MKPGEYNTTDVRHRRFHKLAARCAELEREIEEDHAVNSNQGRSISMHLILARRLRSTSKK